MVFPIAAPVKYNHVNVSSHPSDPAIDFLSERANFEYRCRNNQRNDTNKKTREVIIDTITG